MQQDRGFGLAGTIGLLDRAVERILAAARWLALPIVLALFLQWPLRDLVGAYSREINDLGQVLFALYIAAAVTAATRARTHLAADTLSQHYSDAWRRRLARLGVLAGLLPWSLIVLVTSSRTVASSIGVLERFSETSNPGYFIIKVALWLLGLLMLIQGIIELARPTRLPLP